MVVLRDGTTDTVLEFMKWFISKRVRNVTEVLIIGAKKIDPWRKNKVQISQRKKDWDRDQS